MHLLFSWTSILKLMKKETEENFAKSIRLLTYGSLARTLKFTTVWNTYDNKLHFLLPYIFEEVISAQHFYFLWSLYKHIRQVMLLHQFQCLSRCNISTIYYPLATWISNQLNLATLSYAYCRRKKMNRQVCNPYGKFYNNLICEWI